MCSLGPSLADACTDLASLRHGWTGNFLSTVQTEKQRPQPGLALKELVVRMGQDVAGFLTTIIWFQRFRILRFL